MELTKLNSEVYSMSIWSNPLHPDVFPGVCKMEAEVVQMSAKLFGGDGDTCGTVNLEFMNAIHYAVILSVCPFYCGEVF